MSCPLPKNEIERQSAVERYDIFDNIQDENFDRITRLAAAVFQMPIALVSIIDRDRQWWKSRVGLCDMEGKREHAFCAHAIMGEDIFVVEDAHTDERFIDNPLVTGNPNIRFYAGAPLITEDGFVLGTLCVIDTKPREFSQADRLLLKDLAHAVMTEIALKEKEAQAKAFEALSVRDALTGALNRRGYDKEVPETIGRAVLMGSPLHMAVIDIDHFKAINDRYGHVAGDLVLKAMADLCMTSIRGEDRFYRLGGEEFAIVMPGVDIDGALLVLNRLMARIRKQQVMLPDEVLTYRVSMGLTGLKPGDNLAAMYKRADQALYEAKGSGRDKIVICEKQHKVA